KLAKVSKKLLTTLKLKCKQQWLQHSKIKSHIAIVRRYDWIDRVGPDSPKVLFSSLKQHRADF
ncbi:MAG: hypothetical protein WAW14_07480, partial [Lactococcus raffinolactis]